MFPSVDVKDIKATTNSKKNTALPNTVQTGLKTWKLMLPGSNTDNELLIFTPKKNQQQKNNDYQLHVP